MEDEVMRKRSAADAIRQRIRTDRGEFFAGFVPWPEDVEGFRRSRREELLDRDERMLVRTVWDNPQDRDIRALIDVTECRSAAEAVEALLDRLEENQLAQVPAGPAGLGLASFQHPEFAPPAVFFARGNLAITVTSFGRNAIEADRIARRLDSRLIERPEGTQRPMSLEVSATRGKVGQDILLRYVLPVVKGDDGYLKLFVDGGSISRQDGQLVIRASAAGRIDVQAYLVEPGRELYGGATQITIE